jgi:PAS domain S-box-containing protein
MSDSIHGERTASEPQDRSSSVAHLVEVPPEIIRKWQEFVDLLAEIMHVPSASIMRVDPPHIKVFVSSTSKGNPCEPGALDTGPYCETVMKTGQPLLVPDARENEAWKANPHLKLGMISYLGVPIGWPDGRLFGTICVRDNKRNEYSEAYLKLLLHFRDMLQADLKLFATLHSQLEQHEAKIRRLVDANIIGIIIWDLEGRILEANDAFLRMGGYDRKDLISGRLNRTGLTPPEWRERDARTDAELRMTGAVQPFEKEYFRKDGGRVPVLIGGALFEQSGSEGGVAFVLDQTERKRAEEALRGSEAKFRDYAESGSDWYWESDPDHKFTRVTDYGQLLAVGLRTGSRIGLARWEYATDVESEPEKWELHRSVLDAHQPFRDFVYRAARSDGSPVYYKISGKPVFDANGEFRGYRGAGSDATEITRAQEALRESERSARSAIDGIAGLVAIMAPNGELETVNRRLFEYFGRSLEELKNWGTSDAVHPEDLPHVVEIFTKAVASGIPYQLDQRLRRFDGEYRWFDVRGLPIRDDSGRIARWYVLLTDIEDRTRALARLEQMQSDFAHMNRVATMGQLTASITHEVKQPITATAAAAEAALHWLDRQPPNLEEARQMLADIVKDSHRAGDVIDRMRDLIKKAPPRKDRVEINGAIREVIQLTYSEAVKNGVSVQTQFAESLPLIQGDRVQLQQVMLNLIINAIQAMSGSGDGRRELQISTETDEAEGVRVRVRDSGPGFAPAALERVFEPFYTTKPEGMGMGLSICRSIIEAHGGRLWATGCEPRGALFQFTIPAD